MSDYANRMMRSAIGSSTAQHIGQTGVVTFWNRDKGFGFVRRNDGGRDLFLHINQVAEDVDELTIGQKVRFEIGTDPRSGKAEAKDVRLIESDDER